MSRKVIVLSGISGSGKSFYRDQLLKATPEAVSVSADDYFIDPATGEYKFDVAALGAAHGRCFGLFIAHMFAGTPMIIVDNTNTTAVDISPYMLGAAAFGYSAVIHTLRVPLDVALGRNQHGVSEEEVTNQFHRLRARYLQPYWDAIDVTPDFTDNGPPTHGV